jgi:sec-independent protein translocase protein TatA
MFDTGELLVILLVAFLVFGPKKLPELARTLGQWVAELRKGMHNATVEMKSEFDEIDKKYGDDKGKLAPHEEKLEGKSVGKESGPPETHEKG